MSYFRFHVIPSHEMSSGVIRIDAFPPNWQETAAFFGTNHHFQAHFQTYVRTVATWARVPGLQVTFHPEHGLKHVHTDTRNALDLIVTGREPHYSSHNIHSSAEVAAVTAVMSQYIDHFLFKMEHPV